MPAMASDARAADRAALSAGSSFDALLFAASSQLEQPATASQTHAWHEEGGKLAGAAGRRPRSPAAASQRDTNGTTVLPSRAARKRRSPAPLEEFKQPIKHRSSAPRGPPPELLAVPTAATRRCQSLLSSAKAAIREAQELAGQTATSISKLGWPPASADELSPVGSPARGRGRGKGKAVSQETGHLVKSGAALPPRQLSPPGAAKAVGLGRSRRTSPQASPRAADVFDAVAVQRQEQGSYMPPQHLALLQQLQAAQVQNHAAVQAAEPQLQPSHHLQALGQQHSWPRLQAASFPSDRQQQQLLQRQAAEAGLLQQLIAAGVLPGGSAASPPPPTLQRGSAPNVLPAAGLQMTRQRSLSNPELCSPPSGGRVARPVARRLQSLGRPASLDYPSQLRELEEPLPASAFEDNPSARMPSLSPFGMSDAGGTVGPHYGSRMARPASFGGPPPDAQPGAAAAAAPPGGLSELLASAAAASRAQQASQAAAVQAALEALAAGQQPTNGAVALAAAQQLAAAFNTHTSGGGDGDFAAAAAAAAPSFDGPRGADAPATPDEQLLGCPGCGAARPLADFPLNARNAGRPMPWCRSCCAAAAPGIAGGRLPKAASPPKPPPYRRSLSDTAAARQQQHETLRRLSDDANTLQRLSNSSQVSALTSGAILHSSGSLSGSGSLRRGSQSTTSTANAAAAAAAAKGRANAGMVGNMLAQWGAKRLRLDPATAA